MNDLFSAFQDSGFEEWVGDLTFIGTRVVTDDEGRDYEEDDVETVIRGCIIQPYGDAQISLIPEGIRERVELLAELPKGSEALIKQDDGVRDSDGIRYQIIFYKNWRTHVELKLRRE